MRGSRLNGVCWPSHPYNGTCHCCQAFRRNRQSFGFLRCMIQLVLAVPMNGPPLCKPISPTFVCVTISLWSLHRFETWDMRWIAVFLLLQQVLGGWGGCIDWGDIWCGHLWGQSNEVGPYHNYTLYIRYSLQGFHQTYDRSRHIHTCFI